MLKPYTRNIFSIESMYSNIHLTKLQKKQLDKILHNCLFSVSKHDISDSEVLSDVLEHTDKYNIIIQDYRTIFDSIKEAEIDIYSPRTKNSYMYRIVKDDSIINCVTCMSNYRLTFNTVYIITTNLKNISQIRSLVRGN